jgi:CDP-diacylglycerol--serine O-phosphatidyltransferase
MAINGNVNGAVYCLMFSGFFDTFDGKVARTKERGPEEQKFGIQLDSLSDLVCFGVLPTTIGYAIGMHNRFYLVVFFIYVMAALTRLAYFNVMEEERQDKTPQKRKEYIGLPVTAVALLIPLIYIVGKFIEIEFHKVYGIALLIIAFLFLLKFRVKKPDNKAVILLILLGIAEIACMILGFHYVV